MSEPTNSRFRDNSSSSKSFLTALVANASLLAIELSAFVILKRRLGRFYAYVWLCASVIISECHIFVVPEHIYHHQSKIFKKNRLHERFEPIMCPQQQTGEGITRRMVEMVAHDAEITGAGNCVLPDCGSVNQPNLLGIPQIHRNGLDA